MFHRSSPARRVVAEVLVWTLTATSVWSAVPLQARGATASGSSQTPQALARASFSPTSFATQSGGAPAAIPFFGPRQYVRTAGPPNVFTATIAVPAWLIGPYTMHVQNGEPGGARRLSSATIEINGRAVASQSDFNQNVAGFDRTVTLTAASTLRVRLTSNPNGFLTLTIGGATGDRTAPQTAIDTPASGSVINNASPQLAVTYADAVGTGEPGASGLDLATLKITLDDQDRTALFAKGPARATADLTGVLQLVDGVHTLATTIKDVAGNQGGAAAQFRIDRSAPTVRILTPTTGAYLNAGTVAVTGTVAEEGPGMTVTVNGTPATLSGASFSVALPVSDGRVDLHVVARDAAGNESAADGWVVVDTVAPVLTVTAPAGGFVSGSTTVHVAGTVTDMSPVGVLVNGASVPVTDGSFSADTQIAGEGDRTIEVVSEDRAGNRSATSTTVVVDLSAPAIQISQPANDAFVATASPAIQIAWSDNVGIVPESLQVLVDGQDVTSQFTTSAGGAAGTLTGLSEAQHQIEATVRDRGGNMGSATASFTVDTAAPEITIAQPASHEFTNATSIDVSGTVTDRAAVTVTVDGVATTLSNETFTVHGVPIGDGPTQPIAIVAVDAAGNRSEAIVTLHVDRTPPGIHIDAPSANAYLKGPLVEVTGTVSDASPVVGVDVNGVAATLTGLSFAVQIPVTDGTFAIRATARDAANNVSVSEISVGVDSAPPAILVSSPAEGYPTNEAAVTVDGTVSDTSPTKLQINSGGGSKSIELANGTFSQSVALGPEGPNTIAFLATDAAGNQASFDLHVVRDLTPPTLEIANPQENSVIGSQPVSVTGFVYDLTAATVRVNGADASRVQDSWTGVASFGAEGTQTISVAAVDAAGNQSTATRHIMLDLNAPVVTIDPQAGGALTASDTVTVSGSVADLSLASVVVAGQPVTVASGTPTTRFSASVPLADGDNHVHVVAMDRLGRTGEAEVVLTRDSIAPSIQVTAPDTISRRRGAQATVSASDNLGLAQVVVMANGVPLGTFTTASFTVDLTAPDTLAVGAQLVLIATAVDRAGNSTTATHLLRVIADGVLVGQAIDDRTGLPLDGATVRMSDRTTQTAARGGYSLPATDVNVRLSVAKPGMTSVDRVVPVQSGVGTAVVDARLTPLAAPKPIVAGVGGTLTTNPGSTNPESLIPHPISITVPPNAVLADALVRLTALSPQGLPALLPLGWSPLAAFDLRSSAPIAELTVTATLTAVVPIGADDQTTPPALVHLVQYRPSLHAWVMVAPNAPVSNGSVALTLSGVPASPEPPQIDVDVNVPTAFAVVVADVMDPPIAVAAVNEPLAGVDVMLLPATVTSGGAVTPAILPPGGGTAVGVIGIQSPSPLPSGTIVQAQVTETFTLVAGDTASEEMRSQDIVLYRLPVASPSVVQGFTPALSASLPITPTRTFAPGELVEGHVHFDIVAGREAVRGQTGGSEPLALTVDDVTFIVPAHALPDDTAIRVQRALLSAFLPAGADLQPLAEIVVDLSGRSLGLAAELSIPAGAVNPIDRFLLGRVERVDGVPRVAIVGLAAVAGDRLVSRAAVGLPGVTIGGRYVFYRTSLPFGFIGATMSSGVTLISAIASTDRWPFIARGDGAGRATLVAPEGAVQVSARVPGTALAGSANATLVADQLTAVAVDLGGIATMATVTPPDGALAVTTTTQIEIATSAAIAQASVDAAVVRLRKGDTTIAIRLVLAGSGRMLAVVPQARLEAGVRYQLDVAGLVDVYGGAIAVPPSGFTTASETALEFNPDALVVSFPDEDGIVDVTAPAGSLQPGTSVLIVNAGSGEVISFTAGNDGSLHGQLSATIDHRLIVTITDPQGKGKTFQRSKYVAPDGTTAIGAGGGTVEGDGGIQLRLPEGAVDAGVVLKIEPFDIATMEERPALPGGHFGSGMKIGLAAETHFKKEVDLAFPVPAGAPANPKDAFYYVYRRIDGPNGQVLFESVDHAAVEGEGADARVVTASYPFTGFKDGWNRWDPTHGTDMGVNGFGQIANMGTCIAMVFWIVNALLPGAPVGGAISGRVLRPRFVPGSTTPVYDGVDGVLVRRDDASDPSATVAFTHDGGVFTFVDPHFTTGATQIRAETAEGTFTAMTFAVAGLDTKLVTDDALAILIGKGTFKNVATANITLPPAQPLPPAPQVTIRLFTETDNVRREVKGLVIAGTPLVVGFSAVDGTVTGATINGEERSVHEDPKRGQASANGMDAILDQVFTPAQPGSYTITGTAMPPFGSPVNASLSLRVIAAGGGTYTSVPGRPGVLSVTPRSGSRGVPVTTFLDVAFTEPVTGVTPAAVKLEETDGTGVPVRISGVGLENGEQVAVDDVGAGHVVTSLTLVPRSGLKYNAAYRIVLTSAIVDRDADANNVPTPQPLVEFTSTFTTFGPEALGGSAGTPRASGLVVLGDRAYIAETLHTGGTGGISQVGNLRVYDIENPALPEEIPPETWIGYPPRDIAGEATDEGLTKTVVVATAPRTWFFLQGELIYFYEIRSTSSNLFVYDVSNEPPKWVGAVSLTDNLMDGTPNRIVMKDGMVYAATLQKGIQVVDVQAAKNGFPATGVPDRDFVFFKKVYDGGVNKDAIVNTIPINELPDPAPNGQRVPLPLADLKVDDFVIEGVSRRLVLATGSRKQIGLVIVDPLTGETLWRGEVTHGGRTIDWPTSIALANVDGHPLALVGGYGAGTNLLAIIDLSPLAQDASAAPVVVAMVQLSHTVGDILVKDKTAIVSGGQGSIGPDGQPGVATLVDLTIPATAHVVGTIAGVGSRMALSGDNVLLSTERSFIKGLPTALGGVRTAALGTLVVIDQVTPVTTVLSQAQTVSARDTHINVRLVPRASDLDAVQVKVLRNGVTVSTLDGRLTDAGAEAVWPAGQAIDLYSRYEARAIADPGRPAERHSADHGVPIVQVDADVDSENKTGLDTPRRTVAEDRAEDLVDRVDKPGKIVFANDGDRDADGIPDFADGHDVFGPAAPNASAPFVPLIVELPAGFDLSKATLRFTYASSHPQGVVRSGSGDDIVYAPAPGTLRLWTKDGGQARRAASAASGGDFVASGETYQATSFAAIQPRTWKFYVEAVTYSREVADQRIVVEASLPDTDGSPLTTSDAVRLTALTIRPVELTNDNDVRPASRVSLSHPSPLVTLSSARLTNVHLSADARQVLADLNVAGAVSCAVCDYTPGDLGTINTVRLSFNDSAESTTVGVSGGKDTEGPSLLRPYRFTGTFSAVVPDVEIHEGQNKLRVEAADKVYGITGYAEVALPVAATEPQMVTIDQRVALDFGGVTSLASLTAATPVWVTVTDRAAVPVRTFSGDVFKTSDTPLVFSSDDATVTILDPMQLSSALSSTVRGAVQTTVAVPSVAPVPFTYELQETGDATNVFGRGVLSVRLTESRPMGPDVTDVLTLEIENERGLTSIATLTETGASTGDFMSDDGTFAHIVANSSLPSAMVSVVITSPTLGIEQRPVMLVETEPGSSVFEAGGGQNIYSFDRNDFRDWTFEPGDSVAMAASNGGEFHPYLLQVLGPEALLSQIAQIDTGDGPRKIERAANGNYYLFMKHSPPAPLIVMATPGLDLGAALASLSFFGGYLQGFAGGGYSLLEGAFTIFKTVVVETVRLQPVMMPIIMTYGDQYKREQDFGRSVKDITLTMARVAENIKQDRNDYIIAILTGNEQEVARLSAPYRLGLSASVELLKALFEEYANLPPGRQGYLMGRAMFEIFLLAVPFAKAGQLSKLEFLNQLKNLPLFQDLAGQRAFAKLQPLMARLGGCLCFAAGTLVQTENGLRNIEDIRPGERVWSRDPVQGTVAYKRVLASFTTHPDRLLHVRYAPRRSLTDGNGGEGGPSDETVDPAELITTAAHPFFVVGQQRFVPASELRAGDELLLADGRLATILDVHTEERVGTEPFTTYNLDVEDFHTFFVGRDGVWVHNAGGPCDWVADLLSVYTKYKAEGKSSAVILDLIETHAAKDPKKIGTILELILKDEFPGTLKFWSKRTNMSAGENAWSHYIKHAIDKRDVADAVKGVDPMTFFRYVRNFVDHSPSGTKYFVRVVDGASEEVSLLEATGEFSVKIISGDQAGAVRTYFIPTELPPLQYFTNQVLGAVVHTRP